VCVRIYRLIDGPLVIYNNGLVAFQVAAAYPLISIDPLFISATMSSDDRKRTTICARSNIFTARHYAGGRGICNGPVCPSVLSVTSRHSTNS